MTNDLETIARIDNFPRCEYHTGTTSVVVMETSSR